MRQVQVRAINSPRFQIPAQICQIWSLNPGTKEPKWDFLPTFLRFGCQQECLKANSETCASPEVKGRGRKENFTEIQICPDADNKGWA